MNSSDLAKLAIEVNEGDPIDFGMLLLDEEEAFKEIAEQVISMLEKYDPQEREYVAMAAMTKLIVENFVLHAQLISKGDIPCLPQWS